MQEIWHISIDSLSLGCTYVVKRFFKTYAPNQIWVSDITQFMVKGIYYYICVVIDLFSRKVIAYNVSTCSSTRLVSSTFKKAFSARGCPESLIFHSDQGSQYTSRTFRSLLANNNVIQSFSNPGTPTDNAVAESFFANLKKGRNISLWLQFRKRIQKKNIEVHRFL